MLYSVRNETKKEPVAQGFGLCGGFIL